LFAVMLPLGLNVSGLSLLTVTKWVGDGSLRWNAGARRANR
jgi:hypothetical protein